MELTKFGKNSHDFLKFFCFRKMQASGTRQLKILSEPLNTSVQFKLDLWSRILDYVVDILNEYITAKVKIVFMIPKYLYLFIINYPLSF